MANPLVIAGVTTGIIGGGAAIAINSVGNSPETLPVGCSYAVELESGDSWSRVAQENGMSMYDLASLNETTIDETVHPQDLLCTVIGEPDTSRDYESPSQSSRLVRDGSNCLEGAAYTVVAGDSPYAIAAKLGISADALYGANDGLKGATIHPNDILCTVDDLYDGDFGGDNDDAANPVDDLAGEGSSKNSTESGVVAQQNRINSLIGHYGMSVYVDGIDGPQTDQARCITEDLQGSHESLEDIQPNSDREHDFMTRSVKAPEGVNQSGGSWVYINKKCQAMVVGSAAEIQYIFRTSTGGDSTPTREGSFSIFKYDPASDNNGWHDSSEYPSSEDNPRNGNMYKPLYFSNGQAIHGSTSIPYTPASKGCARLSPTDQDKLIAYLGLDGVDSVQWSLSTQVVVSGGK